ncbi:class I SAM-dependent methyltransferase [Scleromatobacter humisilvae]|uniref:Class I SAM-dependent methyltransferase n=1 Tax=Scleromatobacter humisilvae TaxID=2897159 RepID=A0A9X1YN25_9BURK|nr:class I SAM-dependent methyltransferase [Scleromatobacter humisilvae]MCK9689309.1 class I SAM-dependent methyltransferase [Scleromatobacter humisilvae]
MTEQDPWITWEESGAPRRARWRSESQAMPATLQPADDALPANAAFRLINEGTGLLWRGDFHNGRQLLQALGRRVDKPPRADGRAPAPARTEADPAARARDAFARHREAQARRAALLGRVLLEFEPDHTIALRRAPDVRAALGEAWGAPDGTPSIASLRELQGLIGAHEWRKKGVDVPALGGRIHPWFGVFSPLRGEYLGLIAQAPLPTLAPGAQSLAFDIGTGTGVIAALLAKRGVQQVVATDLDPRAIACATENVARLGFAKQVRVVAADMFPEGRAALVVCNPPWVPTPANAAIERAVYDPDSAMLRAFLAGLAAHLAPGGEGWLVMSDLAEHLGLRTREQMLAWIADAGLRVVARHDTRPTHPKAGDPSDPLFAARSREVTSLWRLGAA